MTTCPSPPLPAHTDQHTGAAAGAGDAPVRRCRGSRGDVMLMTVIVIVFLMTGAWAMVSSGQQWGARRDAQAVAAASARAAAQPSLDELAGGTHLDPALARQRAGAVMAASGYAGNVTVTGLTVTVTVTRPVRYSFPAPGFAGSASGTASAVAARGVIGDEGG